MAIILLSVLLHGVNPAFSTLSQDFIARLRLIARMATSKTVAA